MDYQISVRKRLEISGAVQGVGFRPFVYRLAHELNVYGWILNTSQGVTIDVEGPLDVIKVFVQRINSDSPPHSFIHSCQLVDLTPCGYKSFVIKESDQPSEKTAVVLPDIATCKQCLSEVFDPSNRRYLYPFTNCTHCGPRYSIIEALPYDRVNTTMKSFQMCPDCQREYEDPDDRRFHAQPNACPRCGPQIELLNSYGETIARQDQVIQEMGKAIKKGKIVAIKGIGGFHLFADAFSDSAVNELRHRKRREFKPFALMIPSRSVAERYALISEVASRYLLSAQAPIVLMPKKERPFDIKKISMAVAPNNPFWGIMMPYSPLHHILFKNLNQPLVATSANLAEEPICIDNQEALQRLRRVADLYLVHDRPIKRSIDDSVVRIVMDEVCMIRRARGYAPLPITLEDDAPSILAVGGQLKNTVALNVNNKVFISQHIGDLHEMISYRAFHHTVDSLKEIYQPNLTHVVCDKHPDYYSTQFAKEYNLDLIDVQHHHAHIASCMAENNLDEKVLGICFDGTGWGTDKTVWGGEFLVADLIDFTRAATFKTFRLPGAQKAIKEPKRVALALLYAIYKDHIKEFSDLAPLKLTKPHELNLFLQMMKKGFHSPLTSSLGRLFDAVASLLDVCHYNQEEGQAAMQLEFLTRGRESRDRYSYHISCDRNNLLILEWNDMIKRIIQDIRVSTPKAQISVKFHNTIVEMAVDIAQQIKLNKVILSGGCFQNKYLTEHLVCRLREEGFTPYWHKIVPPNDGGLSLGQTIVAINRIKKEYKSNINDSSLIEIDNK